MCHVRLIGFFFLLAQSPALSLALSVFLFCLFRPLICVLCDENKRESEPKSGPPSTIRSAECLYLIVWTTICLCSTLTYTFEGRMRKLHRIESIWRLFQNRYEHRCVKLKVTLQFEQKVRNKSTSTHFHPFYTFLVASYQFEYLNGYDTIESDVTTRNYFPKIFSKLDVYVPLHAYLLFVQNTYHYKFVKIMETYRNPSIYRCNVCVCAWWLHGWYTLIVFFSFFSFFFLKLCTHNIVCVRHDAIGSIAFLHPFVFVFFHNERTSITRAI